MDINNLLGKSIITTLSDLKTKFAIVEYSKIEDDEFIKLPEEGCFFQAINNTSIISSYRIYIQSSDGYFSLSENFRSKYENISSIDEMKKLLGNSICSIPSIQIPGIDPTLPGEQFLDSNLNVFAHYDNTGSLVYVHINARLDTLPCDTINCNSPDLN